MSAYVQDCCHLDKNITEVCGFFNNPRLHKHACKHSIQNNHQIFLPTLLSGHLKTRQKAILLTFWAVKVGL